MPQWTDIPSVFTFLARLTHFSTTSPIWHQSDLDTMIVPDMTGLDNATKDLNAAANETASSIVADATDTVKTARLFGKAGALPNVVNGTGRTTEAKKEGLQDRQSCAKGSAFYACANGFKGCCSVDPCNPGETCPDGQSSSTAAGSTAASSSKASAASGTAHASTSAHSSTKATSTSKASSTADATSLLTASPTGSSTANATPSASTTGSSPKFSLAPACPEANNTVYADSSEIQYAILCNADNSYASSDSIDVSVGGYGECFSVCSKSSTCAGFTYVGLTSGNCYLKNKMPSSDFVAKSGNNYVSCTKFNVTEGSPEIITGTGRPQKSGGNIGAIAGGVIGGIAFLALLLLLIAFLAKRRQNKTEERRATVTHVFQGPMEAAPTGGHARSGSTAHDAFAPFGGSYHPPAHTRQRSIYQAPEQQWV